MPSLEQQNSIISHADILIALSSRTGSGDHPSMSCFCGAAAELGCVLALSGAPLPVMRLMEGEGPGHSAGVGHAVDPCIGVAWCVPRGCAYLRYVCGGLVLTLNFVRSWGPCKCDVRILLGP